MTETELIQQLQIGSNKAFREMVDVYGTLVYNTALGILQNEEDAEDIAQEVFITVFQSIQKFKGDSKLSTWLYRISVSKCLDNLRSKKRKKRFAFIQSIFGKEGTNLRIDKPDFCHPGVLLENKERATVLFKAIEKLPLNQRTAYTLQKLEDLSYAEIAEIMQLSTAAVESLLFRAKQNLQKILEHYYNENEK